MIGIIGAGIIGATIAWQLARKGKQVALLEKQELGQEASWAAAGMLSPGGELDEHTDPERVSFFLQSRRQYPSFVKELSSESGVAIDYRECGAIELAYTEEEWEALERRARKLESFGIHSRRITPAELEALSPHVNTKGLKGALFCPEDGVVAPRHLLTALRKACLARGVELREHSAVEVIEAANQHVEAGGERFSAAVIAAGAWSSAIQVKGVPTLPAAEPVKGHLLGFDLQLGACPTIVRHKDTYIFQRGSGLVVAGASIEHAGFDRAVDPQVSGRLFEQVQQIFPVVGKLNPVDVWTGLRPKTEVLCLGQWHASRVFLAYGHYRNGILLAPATADQVVSAITAAVNEE